MPAIPGNAATVAQLLAILNQINLKAFSADSRKALIFLMLNDTRKLVQYDRAMLWDMSGMFPKLLGVSGHADADLQSETARLVSQRIEGLHKKNEMEVLSLDAIPGSDQKLNHKEGTATALWLPIASKEDLVLGLWLERWDPNPWTADELKIMVFLKQGYAVAWERFAGWRWRSLVRNKKVLSAVGITVLLLFLIPVPLRVVAPCEVIANDPYLIAAPLEGIIEKMSVDPGDTVQEGTRLFQYDKRVPLEDLATAEKEVQIADSQLNRSTTLGLNDPKALNEAAVWHLELAKQQVNLDLAKYKASQLDVKSPSAGVAIFDNPDSWRGKPVVVGERIMVVADPNNTKVRIWIPERDNVVIDPNTSIKVFLNVDPAKTYQAKLIYVADYGSLDEKGVPSFIAEAKWLTGSQGARLGLKGTAILYGENVPMVYWLFRKPWAAVREFLGF